MTAIEFKRRKVNMDKLLTFGFEKAARGYIYHTDLVDGQMTLTVLVETTLGVYTEVIDNSSGEEYVLHRVANAAGSFVGRVKSEYEAVLDEISAVCFEPEVFKSAQAKAVMDYIVNTYGDELEYLWQKFPDNAIVRRKDNQKWYVAILTVSRRKLGFDSDESVEILDLRLKPDEMDGTVDYVRYFPGYHMNKRHWITICLDGTVCDEELYARIDTSYELAKK